MSEGITSICYGTKGDLFVSGRVLSIKPFLELEWLFGARQNRVKTNMIGEYNLSNALAAITIGKYLGVKSSLICKALEEYIPTNNRSQLKETGKNMLIIDAYNANPTSMHAALENFDHMDVGHKVLILGDMKELGPDTDMEHQKIADYITHHDFERVMLIGDSFSRIDTQYPRFRNPDDLKEYLEKNPVEDSYVLLKGSRGVQLERCIEML
jgi:UDP-N-acetylmuramoyl-tripeptide--D-alanyl-D-alanine ligase